MLTKVVVQILWRQIGGLFTWPNQDDRKLVRIWPKKLTMTNVKLGTWPKLHNIETYLLDMTKIVLNLTIFIIILTFGHIHKYRSVVVLIFIIILTFGYIHTYRFIIVVIYFYFWSSSSWGRFHKLFAPYAQLLRSFLQA